MVIKLTLDWILLKGNFCFQWGKKQTEELRKRWRVASLEFPNLDVKADSEPVLFYLFRLYCG